MQSVSSNAVAQAISVIGSTVNGVITTGVYTGTGTFKNDNIGYVDLTKGKWIVILQIEYNASGASSDSVVGLSLGNETWRIRVPNSNQSNDLDLQLTAFVNVTTSTNRTSLYLYHHKTVTIKGQTVCLAIRIA